MVTKYDPNQIKLTLSDAAIAHLQASLKKYPNALGVYMGTRKAGCSGYAYVTELLQEMSANVIKATSNAPFAIYVERDSILHLNGLTVDVEQKALGQKTLVYLNPNEAARCGCGESFMPKDQVVKG